MHLVKYLQSLIQRKFESDQIDLLCRENGLENYNNISALMMTADKGVIYNIQEYIGYHSAAIGLFSSQEGEAEIRQSRELNLN